MHVWGVLLFLCTIHDSALGNSQIFTGKALNKWGELEYVEEHVIAYEGKAVTHSRTTYFDSANRIIGHLTSEYSPMPQFCSYTFNNLRKQYVDGVQVRDNQICLFRKQNSAAEKEVVCLPMEEKQIVGQGFHHFIIDQLDAIASGSILHVKLAVPSRLDQFDFRIRKMSEKGKNLQIRLEIDNWFLRLFAPHVDVVYETENGRIIRYEGISNMSDASGRYKKVRIDYFY